MQPVGLDTRDKHSLYSTNEVFFNHKLSLIGIKLSSRLYKNVRK
jgi:hypothetical protein